MLGDLRGIFILGRICAIGGKKIMGTGNGYQEFGIVVSSLYSLPISLLFTLHLKPSYEVRVEVMSGSKPIVYILTKAILNSGR